MKEDKAKEALKFIIPVLKKYKFNWIITGGFASYVYGVKRPITDIDIDIKINKNSKKFKKFLAEMKPFVTQKLIHFKNKYYNNYNVEISYAGQIIDICPSDNLKVFNKSKKNYKLLYSILGGFPKPVYTKFNSLNLPLLPKKLIIKNKELIKRDKWDLRDIRELSRL